MIDTGVRTREAGEEISPGPVLTAQSRACARDGLSPPGPGSLLSRARFQWAQRLVPVLTELHGKPGALLHDEFGPAYRRHRECALHCESPPARAARMGYGYLHMGCVQAPLDYLKWATSSPLSLFVHALVGLSVWLGLLLGGYL